MDIVGKEALEQMLKGYQGTLVFVSHDRYFVRQVADKILSFDGGVTTYYPFGYEQYEEATADKDDQVSFGKYAAVSPAAKLAIEQEKIRQLHLRHQRLFMLIQERSAHVYLQRSKRPRQQLKLVRRHFQSCRTN